MDMIDWFRSLAHYNRVANERLYEGCAALGDEEYRRPRAVSFGSIHGLLNHVLLGDRIWMSRFEGGGAATPALDTVLYDSFPGLRAARVEEDRRIEDFFASLGEARLSGSLRYVNSQGREYTELAAAAMGHFFNHQTHHRGQVHALLSHAGVRPPSLDLHRVLNP